MYWYEQRSKIKSKTWFSWTNFDEYCSLWKRNEKNMMKHRDIKFVATERRRNYLLSEPNYHTTKIFYGKFVSNRNEKNWNTYE